MNKYLILALIWSVVAFLNAGLAFYYWDSNKIIAVIWIAGAIFDVINVTLNTKLAIDNDH